METQPQKYNGNNHYNNKVHVDFKKRTVKFDPIIKGNLFTAYMSYLTLIEMYCIWGSIPFLLLEVIFKEYNIWIHILIGFMLFGFLASLKFFDRKWRNDKFPEANSMLHGFLKKKKPLTFNPEALIHNKAYIPLFDNVKLEYKASGDFGRYIKTINITNIFQERAYEWMCVFTFKRRPTKGELTVNYQ